MGVQALRTELAVERLDEAVIRGLAGPREVQGDVVGISPQVEIAGDELAAIVGADVGVMGAVAAMTIIMPMM